MSRRDIYILSMKLNTNDDLGYDSTKNKSYWILLKLIQNKKSIQLFLLSQESLMCFFISNLTL